MSKIYVLVICIVQCLNKDKKLCFLLLLHKHKWKDKKKKKVVLLLWPQTSFFVILLASGLATAFLSQDEIV